jgi:UDP-N-acetyl-D-mannosaminuronic acid dehydrogenase
VNSTKLKIIPLARQINDSMPNVVLQIIRKLLKDTKGATISVFGVAYKGDVDDARETPATKFIKLAENEGFSVKVHDPFVKDFEYKILDLNEAVKESDCIVLITDHTAFKQIDPLKIASLMRKRYLVDTRNILDHEKWKRAGFTVEVLGKSS